jgi:hypothetical protein
VSTKLDSLFATETTTSKIKWAAQTIHGHARKRNPSRTYICWQNMRRRCTEKTNKAYKYYGGRGITFCARWKVFGNFLNDMGEAPNGMTLDRKDVAKNYTLKNCKWSSWHEQANNRRDNILISFKGKTATITEWSKITGLPRSTITNRHFSGWSADRILTQKHQYHPY